MTTLEEVIREASKKNRICPQPYAWNDLWETLPERRRQGAGWEPPLPLILAAWSGSSDSDKRDRFHLHINWAHEHGVLDKVASFLDNLKPEDWYTEE